MTLTLRSLDLPRSTLIVVAGIGAAVFIAILTILLSPLVLIATPLLILGTIVAIRWPYAILLGVIASVPVQQVGAIGSFTATRVAIPAAVFVAFMSLLLRNHRVAVSRLATLFFALIGWMCISATRAKDTGLAQDEILRWIVAFTAFLVAVQLLSTASSRFLTGVVVCIGVVAAAQAIAGAFQSLLALGPASFLVSDGFLRGYGTFGRPNTFAGYLEISFFPVLWLGIYRLQTTWDSLSAYRIHRRTGFWSSRNARRSLLFNTVIATVLLACAAAIASGIAVSFSRGAWIGVAFGLALSGALAFRRAWIPILALAPAIIVIAILLAMTAAPASVTDRLGSIVDEARPVDAASVPITDDNFATVERLAHWQAGWNMFRDQPILGIGPGNFNVNYPDYFVRSDFRFSQGHAHNYYIHSLAETGVVGFILYLILIGSALMYTARIAVRGRGPTRAIGLGAFGTTVAFMVHNVFENLHVLNLGVQISVIWAIVVVAARMEAGIATNRSLDMEYSST